MALGSHAAWKGEDGAADDAWNDNTHVNSSSVRPSTTLTLKKSNHHNAKIVKPEDVLCTGNLEVLGPDPNRCHILELPPALILEVFTHLDARALCILSCACVLFRRLASDSHGWKDFYCERWGLPAVSTIGAVGKSPEKTWRELYMAREEKCKVLMGRFQMDMLHGHTAAVRCIRLLPAANLVVTAGYDQVVRVWNLEEGLPLVCSRPLGETVRAIAVDMDLLAAAGSDAIVRIWRAIPECPQLFDVAGNWSELNSRGAELNLFGHTGPITCLGLDTANVYSGSWDMSIRICERTSFRCIHQLMHNDWVWALVPRGRRVLSTAGSDVYSWDIETGQKFRVRSGVHAGQAYAVEGSHSGNFVFTGGEDGIVRMFDDRPARRRNGESKYVSEPLASWMLQKGAVYSLAFEDPWLISASAEGPLGMMDVRQIIKKASGNGKSFPSSSSRSRVSGQVVGKAGEEVVQRFLPGFHQSAYSVDIGVDRVVSGGEEKIVRIWDFSQALEIERSIQASRRANPRRRRKQVAIPVLEQKGRYPKKEDDIPERPDVASTSTTKAGGKKESAKWVALGRPRKGQTAGDI